jgi:hypothetical protein
VLKRREFFNGAIAKPAKPAQMAFKDRREHRRESVALCLDLPENGSQRSYGLILATKVPQLASVVRHGSVSVEQAFGMYSLANQI